MARGVAPDESSASSVPSADTVTSTPCKATVSDRGIGGSGHGYNTSLIPVGGGLKVNELTFTSDFAWHPGLQRAPSVS